MKKIILTLIAFFIAFFLIGLMWWGDMFGIWYESFFTKNPTSDEARYNQALLFAKNSDYDSARTSLDAMSDRHLYEAVTAELLGDIAWRGGADGT